MKNKLLTLLISAAASQLVFSAPPGGTSRQVLSHQLSKFQDITVPASPQNSGEVDFFFDVSLTVWRASQDGMSFAWANSTPSNSATVNGQSMSSGENVFVKSKYSPGFKIGTGLDLSSDGWDVYLQYTWFNTSQSSSAYTGNYDVFPRLNNILGFNAFAPFIGETTTTRTAKAKWRLNYNEFDLLLGRDFYISPKLQLRPFIGLKGGWQIQHLNTQWNLNDDAGVLGTWELAEYKSRNKTFFWNLGPQLGLDTAWLFNKNFSVFGNVSTGALYSEFTYQRQDFATTQGSADEAENVANFQTINNREKTKPITPVIELCLGVRYEVLFKDDHYRFRVQAGWENQIWFSTNKLQEISNRELNFRNGNLNLQGLTLDIRFDF